MCGEVFLDRFELLLLTLQLQSLHRGVHNPLHEVIALILMLDGCVLDGAYCSGIVDQHFVRPFLVRLYPVNDHVDGNVTAVLRHLNIRLGSGERRRVIGHHSRNFRQDLISSSLAHFPVLDSLAANLLKMLCCLLLDHFVLIFYAILLLQQRLRSLSMCHFSLWLLRLCSGR